MTCAAELKYTQQLLACRSVQDSVSSQRPSSTSFRELRIAIWNDNEELQASDRG